jgi:hypothetical protein
VLVVCCLIVVPLPPGENPFAVNNNTFQEEIFLSFTKYRTYFLKETSQVHELKITIETYGK